MSHPRPQTPSPIPPLALGYIRVSTGRQELSLDAQTDSVQRAAEYQQLGDVEFFAEPNVSGSKPFLERPEAVRMMMRAQHAVAEGFDVTILCPKVDRLGRDTVDVSNTARLMSELGVRLLLLDINVDTRSPMGRAFMQIAAVFAELELAKIRERIQTVMEAKRADGILTGKVCYGWDAVATGEISSKGVEQRRLQTNAAEQAHLRRMLQMRSQGRTYYAIAHTLNAEGIKTKHNSVWEPGTVRHLLNSRTVLDWLEAEQKEIAA